LAEHLISQLARADDQAAVQEADPVSQGQPDLAA
jgi:hypothetical protein